MSVHLTRQDEFALITLDRQEALNALSSAVLRELAQAFDQVAGSDARALIVTGAGAKAFCAGADIKELTGRSLSEQRRDAAFGQAVLARLDDLPMFSVAAINGYAFGGGLELALACTFRVAVATAKMGLPEIKLGLIPGYGGTQRLPRAVGEARALEMILSGRAVEADEALRIGLVHRIADADPVQAAIGFARGFSGFGLPALRLARDAVKRALEVPLHQGLKIEADLNTLAFQTQDAVEGMNAFMEKRKPRFKDR
ncbi:MAG: enoyl-CoA hydratase [Betaproteobacteria bacterium RIFCSPLOWO2_12_FULL_64_23]|nr:MAG: enoyl-CoA hydratase [Betaproteobacteria bacterium RIFCSPLOWO2_12_FULL_64_23]